MIDYGISTLLSLVGVQQVKLHKAILSNMRCVIVVKAIISDKIHIQATGTFMTKVTIRIGNQPSAKRYMLSSSNLKSVDCFSIN